MLRTISAIPKYLLFMMQNSKLSVLFASSNAGKINEMRGLLLQNSVAVRSPKEVAVEQAREHPAEVEEVGATYEENAFLKARALAEWSNMLTIGDDTGLEVFALNGEPGLYTARYAGKGASSQQNMEKLLHVMSGIRDRRARFVCLLCLYDPATTKAQYFRGELAGAIANSPSGSAGFGYDSIFEVDGTGKTLAELKSIGPVRTHRAVAVEGLVATLFSPFLRKSPASVVALSKKGEN